MKELRSYIRGCSVVDMENITAPAPLTTALFDKFESDDRFAGFGYIGSRSIAKGLGASAVARADQDLIAYFTARGWNESQLFAWANSKNGRWTADHLLGSAGKVSDCEAWGYLLEVGIDPFCARCGAECDPCALDDAGRCEGCSNA